MLSQSQPSPENLSSQDQPNKRSLVVKNTLYIIFICLSFYSAWWIFTHGQQWVDFWRYRFYTPSTEVIAIADKTSMTDNARYLFYVSDPAIEDAEQFNSHCAGLDSEQTAVLGCYKLQKIFLYDVDDPRLYGIKEVTAAHEMLHAVYERLPLEEKLTVNKYIQDFLPKVSNNHVKDLIKIYSDEGLYVLLNEMHSILGTDVRNLSPELEEYYKKYFKDRGAVVGLAEAYEGVFTATKQKLSDHDAKLNDIKTKIDSNYQVLETKTSELNSASANLENLRSTDQNAYNAAVPAYNDLVRNYNNLVRQTRDLIAEYNALVEVRNKEAAVQNDLYNSLNSQFETIKE